MKRLRPVALTVASPGELKLRCQPKLDGFGEEEKAHSLLIMRDISVGPNHDQTKLEAEFSFSFNDVGAVLQDQHFFALTNDDDSQQWIDRAVGNFSSANESSINLPDSPCKLRPHTILVDGNDNAVRRYKVVFSVDDKIDSREYAFTVEGNKNLRKLAWIHGSYSATWDKKMWTIADPFPADLKWILLSILRLDEAIHFELMPYALTAD